MKELTILLIALVFVLEYIVLVQVLRFLKKRGVKITRKTYLIIEFMLTILMILIITYIEKTILINPVINNRIEIGKDCCINMNGEIKDNKCTYDGMYMTQETSLKTLGNEKTMEHQIYCKKNQKLINKLKGRED